MATFTLSLAEAIELTGGEIEIVDGISKLVGGDIGLQYYPIFAEAHRNLLTGKIVDHYLNREIGFETIDLFQYHIRRHMNEIMPYYNKLYQTELIEFDPLSTLNINTTNSSTLNQTETGSATNSANSNASSGSRVVNSETPQTNLRGDGEYATAATDANSVSVNASTGDQTNSGESNGQNDMSGSTTGYQGVASGLLINFRETILNIDLMIINELESNFMLIWDSPDEVFNSTRGFNL